MVLYSLQWLVQMTLSKARTSSAIVALVAMSTFGCNDSTGPGTVDASSALQSLSLGFQALTDAAGSGGVLIAAPDAATSLDAITPFLDRINVSIDESSQQMFALGLRETFPEGTCEEDIFFDPGAEPGTCTPAFNPLVLVLWQSHSATEVPDRMLFVLTEAGTTNFDFEVDPNASIALYMEGQDNPWISVIGNLSSQIAGTDQSCDDFTLPPYARSGDCNIANFTEQGSILFAPLQDPTGNDRIQVEIPQQSLHGLWLDVTEVQQISATASRIGLTRALAKRVNAARLAPAR
ncbi:MAG: hypothetical protein ACJ78K_12660 [Gemmatimonadaceae bacterium]